MKKRAILGKTLAVAARSASLIGITTGTASAKPIDGSCNSTFTELGHGP
jgi:hypothetical protein